MKYFTWTLLAVLMLHTPVGAHENCSKAECAKVKEQIRTIESKMRSGYSRAQGQKYADRIRELKAKRYKLCR
jgi:hypothetical protein